MERGPGKTPAAPSRWLTAALVLFGATVLVASRVVARQASLWEWDDAVFLLALDQFAPQNQVPHPPFYPGYVALGRLARALLGDGILALTWLSVAASCLALTFHRLVASEVLGSRRTALASTVLFAFFPAVWLHAGVPLSDPVGLAAGLAALWLALRGRERPHLLVPAAIVLGAAVSIRPQAALPAAIGLIVAAWPAPSPRRVAVALAAVGSVLVLYAAPLVAVGGLGPVWHWTRYQAGFVVSTDSLAAHGWTVLTVARHYWLDIWGSPGIAIAVGLAVLNGVFVLARREGRRRLALALGLFLPYAVLCWVFLDPATAGRYALPYLPLLAMLAAEGLSAAERRFVPHGWPVATAALVVAMAVVTWPAIRIVHSQPSPPVRAATTIHDEAGSAPFRLAFHPKLVMHAAVLFPEVPRVAARTAEALCSLPLDGVPTWSYGTEAPGTWTVAWPDDPVLRRVSRGRYLGVAIGRVEPCVTFGTGFYRAEREPDGTGGTRSFRWMAESGVLVLPPASIPLEIELDIGVPLAAFSTTPRLSASLNGRPLGERTATTSRLRQRLALDPAWLRADAPNELVLTTTESVVPAERDRSADRRRLGLRLWSATLRVHPTQPGQP
ncbi:MAG: hypothetical protein HY825_08630 [Acidobacteria bacterium]|nr:hypothetical protein [Acidobacteriota bacterium]